MSGHRILTLFAAEAAAVFALGTGMTIPATSSAWADPGEHLQAAAARVKADPAAYGRAKDLSAAGSASLRVLPVEITTKPTPEPESSDQDQKPSSKSQSAVEVGVDQDNRSHSSSRSHSHSHSWSHWHCVHCKKHVRVKHVRPAAPAPQPKKLPFTGRNSAPMALGGGAAVLTGAALLWLSSRRRKWFSQARSAAGPAA